MNAVLEVLRSREPIAAACRAAGIGLEEFRRERDELLRSRLPAASERVTLPVSGPVEIVRDRWGIPHVYARAERDALAGLGYCMGRDRLWQLDYLRREALGTLAELLGPSAHSSDLRMRTIGIDLIAAAEVDRVDGQTRELVEAFVAGINKATEAAQGKLPIEFDLLGYEPAPWTLSDTVALLRGLWWQLTGRLENIVAAEAARRQLGDPALLAAFTTPELPDERILPGGSRSADGVDGSALGSNNWVIAGARSTTGRALLASDPHLPFVHPSDFYEAHLSWPGYEVVGAHWAGVPGANFGTNGTIAWGLTNNASSPRDLYVETVRDGAYLRGGRWLPFERRSVEIAVRGEGTRIHEVLSTDLGPVVNDTLAPVEEGGDPPLSMRWIGAEHLDDLKACLGVQRARTWPEYRAALADWSLPIWNWTYADRDGQIGYQCAGRVPLRGRVVRGYRDPSSAEDAWAGYVPYDALPRLERPARGWHATANNRVAPDDYPVPLYGAWAGGNRALRIRQRIESVERVSPAESRAIQHDVYLARAARMVPGLLRALDGAVPELTSVLAGWRYEYTPESSAPTAFETVLHFLAERLVAARFPRRLVGSLHGNGVALAARLLEGEPLRWLTSGTLDDQVRAAGRDALAFLRERLGDDWSWGRVHRITFEHPLAAPGSAFAEVANVGPFPVAGTGDTVRNAAGALGQGFAVTSGAEYRLLVDFAAQPIALAVNVLGQSGQPGSPWFADQTEDWLGDGYHPLLTERAAVERGASARAEIQPA